MELTIRKNAPTLPHKRHWQFCVGSGHALLALRTDYTRQLKMIHDTLGIERVRFHGIFCDDMRTFNDLSMQLPLPGAEAFTEYNFNACGVAYDNVLDAGMKPFVELSFMPGKLMNQDPDRPKNGMFFYRPIIVPPQDEAAWKDYIQAFLRFLRHRYGEEEIRTWYFEVWNEPDLQIAFFNGTRDEYFRLYEITARAIKEIDPLIPVGGPSTSNSKWVRSFVDFCAAHDVPVDFITTHQYAGDPLGGVEDQGDPEDDTDTGACAGDANGASGTSTDEASGVSADDASEEEPLPFSPEAMMQAAQGLAKLEDKSFLNGFRAIMEDRSETTDIPNDRFRKNSAIVRRQAGNLPLFYTEWNENAGFSSYTNDTRKVAAYDVKTALDVTDNLDGSSIWCFSDIFEELHPFPQEFHGGFGMLSQNGIPKPVYHAMKMLADTGDTRIDLGPDATDGEIGAAAFTGPDGTDILLFRQKMKNLDLPKEEAVVRVEYSGTPSITVRRVDEEHGNPLKLWEEMGSPVSLNRAEVEDLKRRSAVQEEAWPFTVEDGLVTVRAELGVNDVYMIRIK